MTLRRFGWLAILTGMLSGLTLAEEKKAEPKKDEPKPGTESNYSVLLREELAPGILSQMDKAAKMNAELAELQAKVKDKKDALADKKLKTLQAEQQKAGEDMKRQLKAAMSKAQADCDRQLKDLDKLNERLDGVSEQEANNVKKQIDEVQIKLAATNDVLGAYGVVSDYLEGKVAQNSPFFLIDKSAPAVSGKLFEPEGKAVSLADYKGKVLVLVFFATTHSGSAAVLQEMIGLVSNYKSDAVALLAIAEDAALDTAKASLGKSKTASMFDTNREAAQMYRVKFLPQVVVIDPDGAVAEVRIGRTGTLRNHVKGKIDDLVKAFKNAKPAAKDAKPPAK